MFSPAYGSSGAEDFVDATIANLRVIGMLQKNGKLCVRRGQLAIEREDPLQGVRRWVAKDSREVTLMHIRNTLTSALKIANTLLAYPAGASPPAAAADALAAGVAQGHSPAAAPGDLSLWTLRRIVEEMHACEAGLHNLRTSYTDDSLTVAAIDVLGDRLRAHCEDLSARTQAWAGAV